MGGPPPAEPGDEDLAGETTRGGRTSAGRRASAHGARPARPERGHGTSLRPAAHGSMSAMDDPVDLGRAWKAAVARAGVVLPQGDAAAAWDEARRLAAVARRVVERHERFR